MVLMNRDELIKILRSRLSDLPSAIKVILLFGSVARGEVRERSDIDLLVLYEGLDIDNPVSRRRYLYRLVMDRIGDLFDAVTLIDMELKEFLKPQIITSLLLNIYWDSIVIIDRTKRIERFLNYVRKRIREAGLVRVKDGKAYYWKLPRPFRRIEIL
ncbi:MAG: hypothetical protein DRZ82_04075 [Thermoprotei archaeon]|nr:MAG: hypothetical protein DRZ82_04075 [Thermoprotei archaeon]